MAKHAEGVAIMQCGRKMKPGNSVTHARNSFEVFSLVCLVNWFSPRSYPQKWSYCMSSISSKVGAMLKIAEDSKFV